MNINTKLKGTVILTLWNKPVLGIIMYKVISDQNQKYKKDLKASSKSLTSEVISNQNQNHIKLDE